MAEYLVLDVDAARRRVALLDGFQGYHVARVADALPPMGTRLHGNHAVRAFILMHDPVGGQVYRFTMEATDCGQEATFRWLHLGPGRAEAAEARSDGEFLRRVGSRIGSNVG
jgi:hypothetical protein